MATTTKTRITSRAEVLRRLERALHGGSAPVAVALTDLDGFGDLNARLGHQVGDEVLAAWERIMAANLPVGGTTARLGGDEYVVVLPGLSAESALVLLDEIREHLADRPVEAGRRVTASIGVAANPPHGTTAGDLLRAAGEALMRAKREGRDRVALYVEEKMVLKSNYYSRAQLDRLAKLSASTDRTEASLLREGLEDLLQKYRERL